MNWPGWLLWGFVSTILLTALMTASQGLGLTRISVPYLVGTFVTPHRDRAKLLGFVLHVLNGWVFSLIYVAAFHSWGAATWWLGAGTGLVHGLFVAIVGLWFLPGLHPRMASEEHGPTVERQLEPPGFLGLNYGIQTPVTILLGHLLYGATLGAFYVLPAS